ncbi:MAG: citrate lyase holo-[acyl-carrier protein] synthase [Paludibacterium sp.]|uniref:citrate lyase holo-[acyl-carrier protein] synthase n=1 Tax=Paludibacterium sp. TaxID=1917523 RepID=UPI0025E1B93E|nr:citrate lyase holo-[acyl-carrier protein] synthase [Paludibacterium sp.]MBV8045699.1 citrate lyase holo-[acyl-carrier protein] synthase [Paludibacterium sp.]MBV8649463.1 citrate lyase holo-[acyl-carrier protein] synthase [Paludibacterium sp.]
MNAARLISLEAMLTAREARVARQEAARARHRLPLISLSLVMPGPVKAGLLPREIMQAALTAVDGHLSRARWPVIERQALWLPTGPEALYAVNAPADALKLALVELEERHTLGRLWDLDVIGAEGQVSRGSLGIAPRPCLICQEPAHACARAKTHGLDQLFAAIQEKVDAYHRRPLVA